MKLKCYIVKDLLPSYLEGLLDEKSKRDVEEHLLECSECNNTLQNMKENFPPILPKIEMKKIDYLKTIKNHITHKNIFSLCILFFSLILFSVIYMKNYGLLPYQALYALLPVVCVSSYFIISDNISHQKKWGWPLSALCIFSGLLTILGLFLMLSWETWSRTLLPQKIGPILFYALWAMIFFHIIQALIGFLLGIQRSYLYFLFAQIELSVISMNIGFLSYLRALSDFESWTKNIMRYLFLLPEGGLIILFLLFIIKKRNSETI